jgi:RNA polymerase sigma factor (sigma-70 family)
MADEPLVLLIEDDDAVRDALQSLLGSADYAVMAFASGEDFLGAYPVERAGCILLDLRLPGMDGHQVQHALNDRDNELPVILITGHGDVSSAVKAMKSGAFDFIEKPFKDQDLIERLKQALAHGKEVRQRSTLKAEIDSRIDRLTPREHEVFRHLVMGQPNKVIAYELGISPRTVEIHRARVMEKLRARSLSDVVRIALSAGLDWV